MILRDLEQAGGYFFAFVKDNRQSSTIFVRDKFRPHFLSPQRWTKWTLTYREICRKAHQTPNPAPAAAATRTRFGRLALASINFRYFFGPNFQRRTCRLGYNAPIIPSPIIVIAAISLSRLPIIESSLSFMLMFGHCHSQCFRHVSGLSFFFATQINQRAHSDYRAIRNAGRLFFQAQIVSRWHRRWL